MLMDSASFSLTFEGPGPDGHSIDVRDLAPSLVALSELFEQANQILGGKAGELSLRAEVTRPGSFQVDLQLAQSAMVVLRDSVLPMLGAVQGANVSLQVLLDAALGALEFLRELGGRIPKGTREIDGTNVLVTVDGGSITVARDAAVLAQDFDIRRTVRKAMGPLKSEEITSIHIKSATRQPVILSKQDVDRFVEPEMPESRVYESESQQLLRLVSLTFKDGNKWRFHDGESEIWASIEDPDFLNSVTSGVRKFANNDTIRCTVRRRQWVDAKGLHAENIVAKVNEHIRGMQQLRLL